MVLKRNNMESLADLARELVDHVWVSQPTSELVMAEAVYKSASLTWPHTLVEG